MRENQFSALLDNSFGNVEYQSDSANAMRFGYAGMQTDTATGLDYDNARYYDPQSGTFISQDPLSFGGGDYDLYRYADDDAAQLVDPTGFDADNPYPTGFYSPVTPPPLYGSNMEPQDGGGAFPSTLDPATGAAIQAALQDPNNPGQISPSAAASLNLSNADAMRILNALGRFQQIKTMAMIRADNLRAQKAIDDYFKTGKAKCYDQAYAMRAEEWNIYWAKIALWHDTTPMAQLYSKLLNATIPLVQMGVMAPVSIPTSAGQIGGSATTSLASEAETGIAINSSGIPSPMFEVTRTTPTELIDAARAEFNSSGMGAVSRANFLRQLASTPEAQLRFTPCEIARMWAGKVPDDWVVHHMQPLFRGGDNYYDNLILVPRQWHQDNFFDLHFYPEGQNPFGRN